MSPYREAAAKVEMMAALVAKIVMRRSAERQEEIRPTIAAKTTAGPAVCVGATADIMAARKMKASATDFWLWLTPSAFVTETLKRVAASVKRRSPPQGASPVQPSSGRRAMATRAKTSSTRASAAMLPSSTRLFQFPFGMVLEIPFMKVWSAIEEKVGRF